MCLRHRCVHLHRHNGTVGQSLGLLGIHRNLLQARSGPPARGSALHDDGPSGNHARPFGAICAAGRQYHELSGQRLLHPLHVLDHHPPRPTHLSGCRARTVRRKRLDGAGGRRRRSPGIYLHRHLLVLGRRRRSLFPVVDVHGARGLAHAQVGGSGRRTPRHALAHPHRLSHGAFDRHPHPQPADHPRAGLYLLFPQIPERYVQGILHRLGHRAGNPLFHQRTDHPLYGLYRRHDRRPGGQHLRAAGQHGYRILLAGALRRIGLGHMVHAPARTCGVEHPAAGYDGHSAGIQLLCYGHDPCGSQPPDEQQQPVESPRPSFGTQPRPVRGTAPALRRLLLGTGRGCHREQTLLPQ